MNFTPEEVDTILNYIKASLEGASIPGREFSHAVEKLFCFNREYFESLKEKLTDGDPLDRYAPERLLSLINCKSELTS
jgi:hypothetical protein